MEKQTKALTTQAREHDSVWANLPWFVNGTLKTTERVAAEAHLTSCLVCRREVVALKALQEIVSSRTADPRCEGALVRLHERIDQAAEGRRVFPWAAVAVLVVVAGLAGLVAVDHGLVADYGARDAFTTLGARTVYTLDDDVMKARIVFKQDVTERQLRELLLAVDAELIDGPTPRGTYTIAMPRVLRTDDVRAAVERLRESRRVIFVEPIVSSGSQRRYD
jgi:hypothetical protein